MSEIRPFYYTDKLDTPHSTAVSNLWYSADTYEVFVKFNSGNIAGYSHFAPAYWEDVRMAYLRGNSIGRLVATRIKGQFPGVCGDIDPQPKTYADTAESIPSEPEVETHNFTVSFNATVVGEFAIDATSVEEALRLFNESHDKSEYIDVYNLGTVKVTGVTQHFGD